MVIMMNVKGMLSGMIWIGFISLIVMGMFAYSDTIINDDDITIDGTSVLKQGSTWTTSQNANGQDLSDVDDLNSSKINGKIYIDAGNASDIQVKVDIGGDIVLQSGNYAMDNTVNFTVDDTTFTIEAEAFLYWNTGAVPLNLTDSHSDGHNFMFYANNLKNFKFVNKGEIKSYHIYQPVGNNRVLLLNNSINSYIFAGIVNNTYNNARGGEGYYITNSNGSIIENLNIENAGSGVMTECTWDTTINNIMGSGSEAVDINGYVQNIVVNNVIWTGHSGSEVIDVGASQNVVINNVLASNALRSIRTHTTATPRFGVCSSITANNITGNNINCYNCLNSPELTAIDSTVEYSEGGLRTVETISSVVYDFKRRGTGGMSISFSNLDDSVYIGLDTDENYCIGTTSGLYSSNSRMARIDRDGGDMVINGTMSLGYDTDGDNKLCIDGLEDCDNYIEHRAGQDNYLRIDEVFNVSRANAHVSNFYRRGTGSAAVGYGNYEGEVYVGLTGSEHYGIATTSDLGGVNVRLFDIDLANGNTIINGTMRLGWGYVQSEQTMTDESSGEWCVKVWSDGVLNATSGAC